MAQLLPRYRQVQLYSDKLEIAIALLEAKIETAREEVAKGRPLQASPQTLRGLPAIGPGVGGVSPDTQPETALLAAENRRERRR